MIDVLKTSYEPVKMFPARSFNIVVLMTTVIQVNAELLDEKKKYQHNLLRTSKNNMAQILLKMFCSIFRWKATVVNYGMFSF